LPNNPLLDGDSWTTHPMWLGEFPLFPKNQRRLEQHRTIHRLNKAKESRNQAPAAPIKQKLLLLVAGKKLSRNQHLELEQPHASPRMIFATLKKIMIPVTSTKVATKGLDAMPGSILINLNMRGSIDPTKVPQIQMPKTEKLITQASPTNETGSLGNVQRLGNW